MSRIPITVVTGFLGAGKTTIIGHVLRQPGAGRVAAIVNELGEIGLDHHLVAAATDRLVLLNAGCLCCQLRSDLVETLRDLLDQAGRGRLPDFDRVVIETSGLAAPGPILHSLIADTVLGERCRLDGVATVVDAVHGAKHLAEHEEAREQVALADRLLLTKTDLAGAATVAALLSDLRQRNAAAAIETVVDGAISPERLFRAGLYDARRGTDITHWLGAVTAAPHRGGIGAFGLRFRPPLPWDGFARWMEFLLALQGENILRVKGLLNVAGEKRPVAVHAIHHMFHRPAQLPRWPDADRDSRLVFIARDLGPADIRATARRFIPSQGAIADQRIRRHTPP